MLQEIRRFSFAKALSCGLNELRHWAVLYFCERPVVANL